MTLDFFEQFRANLLEFPDRVALQGLYEDSRESFSYQQVADETAKVGLFLQASGVEPGHAVGILMENHPRWGIAFLAAQSVGAVIVPFDIQHSDETLANLIQHAECRFLISSARFYPRLDGIQRRLPEPLPILVAGDSPSEDRSWDRVLQETDSTPSLPLVQRELDDPYLIIYTSGTTGNPKGVVLTRRNVYSNTIELLKVVQGTPEDNVLSVLPLYHVLALMVNFIIPLYMGGRVTYLDALDAQRIMKAFREEGITIFVCVPQFYYLLHRRIRQEVEAQSFVKRFLFKRLLSLSHFCEERLGLHPGRWLFSPIHNQFGRQFRIFGVGGARFDVEVAKALRDLGFTFVQAYGMTETAALATVSPAGSDGLGSVGKPLSHVQVKIDSPNERGIGGVLIRGDNVMSEYWQNPKATAEVIRDGWLDSGDLGYLSPDGFLNITGRQKDVIVLSSGKNIYPEELEHFYQSNCPFIEEMCIVGVAPSDAETQERLHAVIVPDFDYLKSQQVVNSYDMILYTLETLSRQLPSHQHVLSFEIRTEPLPRTTTRKIKRFEVMEQAVGTASTGSGDRFEEATAPQGTVEEKIFELLRQVKDPPLIHRKMNLELDLGFDSLGRVEFFSTVQETLGVRISDSAAAEIFTVEHLVALVVDLLGGKDVKGKDVRQSWTEILNEDFDAADAQKVGEILVRRPVIEAIFYLTAKLVHFLSKILFRIKVTGRENLPRKYPFMLCPNHLSFLDSFLVVGVLPYHVIKQIFFLGYSDYFGGRYMSKLGGMIKVVPVDSDRHLKQALRLGAEGLRRNLVLCVFPEGTRSIDGSLKRFRKGPGILATELNIPLVPVGIKGTYEAWSRGSNKIRLHPVEIHFGKAFSPDSSETSDAVTQRLFQEVDQLITSENTA